MYTKNKKIKKINRILMAALISVSMLASSMVVYADENDTSFDEMKEEEKQTQSTITNLEKKTKQTREAIDSLQQQKAKQQSTVDALQDQSKDLSSTYNKYSKQLDALNDEISDAEEMMKDTSKEILEINNELSANKKKQEELYNKLMLQMKSYYENGNDRQFATILLSSKTTADFLNNVMYVQSIADYQGKLLADYKKVQGEIEEKAAVLDARQKEIDDYQASLDEKQDQLVELADNVADELHDTNAELKSEKSKLADYDAQLSKLDKEMKALEAQSAAAQAKLAQQIAQRLAAQEAAGNKEDTSGAYVASGSELEWLAATIQAEAGGESYVGKLAVGSVIMNRVKSSSFPNTIQGVITQHMQFASYRSGKVALIMANGANSTCIQAAQEVLDGARVGDYLFFMTKYYADYYGIASYEMIGNHAFFYRWITVPKQEVPAETPVEEVQEEQPAEEVYEEQPAEENYEEQSE